MKLNNFAKVGAALAAAGVLALGGATAANAATSSGHVDVVGWDSTTSGVGSIFGSTFDDWPLSTGNEEIRFYNPLLPKVVTCSGGTYTIPETTGTLIPNAGFTNHSGANQSISLTTPSGTTASFVGEHGFNLTSGAGSSSLDDGDHDHGEWKLKKGNTCVAFGQTESFDLTFNAGGISETFEFKVKR